MKYKLKKSLLAIILSPLALCFMANATAPFPIENDYSDFTYTLVERHIVKMKQVKDHILIWNMKLPILVRIIVNIFM